MSREFPTRLENFKDWVKKMELNAEVNRPARTGKLSRKSVKGKRKLRKRRRRSKTSE